MREDIRKNFVLLSKVAKEKRYAQEYLGLLARRGDIGSIRIGKRWYTTTEWFEEFLEKSQKKKIESVCEAQVAEPMKVEPAKVDASTSSVDELAGKPEKIAVFVKTKPMETIVRKNTAEDTRLRQDYGRTPPKPLATERGQVRAIREIRNDIQRQPGMVLVGISGQKKNIQITPQMEAKFKNVSVAERNRYAVPYQEIKFRKSVGVFSPDFSAEEEMSVPMFGRLAFAFSFAVMILLIAASAYFVWSGGLFAKGKVAGASDERNVGLSGIKPEGEYFLASASDKMKEALSVSRLIVEAARERENKENSANRGD